MSAVARGLVKLAMGEENESGVRRSGRVAENEIFRHFALFDSDKDGALTKVGGWGGVIMWVGRRGDSAKSACALWEYRSEYRS